MMERDAPERFLHAG